MPDGTLTVAEDTDLPITGLSTLSISDVDAGNADITTTLSVLHGTLTVGGEVVGGAGVAYNETGNMVTLTGTVAEINATLATVVYHGVLNYTGPDELTVTTNDGGATGTGGILTDTDTVAITVNAVGNLPPVIDLNPASPGNDNTATYTETFFSTDFNGSLPPQILPGAAALEGVQGYAGVSGGQFSGSFLRSPTNNIVTLQLDNFPHTTLYVDYQFAAIDSLDGSLGGFNAFSGDYFNVQVNNATIFDNSFANALPFPTQIQSYVPPRGFYLLNTLLI